MPSLPRADYVSPPWWPSYPPHRKQQIALWGYERTPDLVYGGAAGGGKTDYLLMAASQFCAYPGYRAVIIRDTFRNLMQDDGLFDQARRWWGGGQHGIQWNREQFRYEWPSTASVGFGHMSSADAHLNYRGARFHFVGFDEAVDIPSNQIVYLHSRMRKPVGDPIPLRFRIATNPGGKSHEWIRQRYVKGADGRRKVYLPALLHENPGLDREEYLEQLAELDPITRRQLEAGDWDVHLSGGFFEVGKIRIEAAPPGDPILRVRSWDLAATPEQPGLDPDYTVGALLALYPSGDFFVEHIHRLRAGPAEVESLIRDTAHADGVDVPVLIEQEPGSSGVLLRRHFAVNVLQGFDYRARPQSGSKYDRAKPLAAAVANGIIVWSQNDPHRLECFAELRAFNENPKTYANDDVVDSVAMGYNELTRPRKRRMRVLTT